MKYSSTFGALAPLTFALVMVGCAPSVYPKDRGVEEMLRTAKDIARGRGFTRTLGRASGFLDNRQRDVSWFDLKAGKRYLFVGLCEEACTDLDLEMFDGEGFVLAGDTLEDDIPIFEMEPDQDGRFVVSARMIDCRQEPCVFAIGVYRE